MHLIYRLNSSSLLPPRAASPPLAACVMWCAAHNWHDKRVTLRRPTVPHAFLWHPKRKGAQPASRMPSLPTSAVLSHTILYPTLMVHIKVVLAMAPHALPICLRARRYAPAPRPCGLGARTKRCRWRGGLLHTASVSGIWTTPAGVCEQVRRCAANGGRSIYHSL